MDGAPEEWSGVCSGRAGGMGSCPGNVEPGNRWEVKLMYASRITENRKLVLKGVGSGSWLC